MNILSDVSIKRDVEIIIDVEPNGGKIEKIIYLYGDNE